MDKSSSLLRLLGCYGSAFYGEIFNALGTDIVTACLLPVKGNLNEWVTSRVWLLDFQGSAFLGETVCRVMGNEG
jgi:hypothetical protein